MIHEPSSWPMITQTGVIARRPLGDIRFPSSSDLHHLPVKHKADSLIRKIEPSVQRMPLTFQARSGSLATQNDTIESVLVANWRVTTALASEHFHD